MAPGALATAAGHCLLAWPTAPACHLLTIGHRQRGRVPASGKAPPPRGLLPSAPFGCVLSNERRPPALGPERRPLPFCIRSADPQRPGLVAGAPHLWPVEQQPRAMPDSFYTRPWREYTAIDGQRGTDELVNNLFGFPPDVLTGRQEEVLSTHRSHPPRPRRACEHDQLVESSRPH